MSGEDSGLKEAITVFDKATGQNVTPLTALVKANMDRWNRGQFRGLLYVPRICGGNARQRRARRRFLSQHETKTPCSYKHHIQIL